MSVSCSLTCGNTLNAQVLSVVLISSGPKSENCNYGGCCPISGAAPSLVGSVNFRVIMRLLFITEYLLQVRGK